MAGPTRATRIAALEAQRNEDAVLSQGSLYGERRAAWARIAMVVMFAATGHVGGDAKPSSSWLIVGGLYTVFAVISLIVSYRIKIALIARSRVRPLQLALVDFTVMTVFGWLEIAHGVGFHVARHAVTCGILLSFTVARIGLFHVVWSLLLAETSLLVLNIRDGSWGSDYLFMAGGYVVMALTVGLTNVAMRGLFRDLRGRDNLTRFLPQQVVDRVLHGDAAALAPVQREVTVLFSDIRGFTGLAEKLAPTALLAMLDDYFGQMGQVVKGHDGVIGKFIGDGLLAYWNVPDQLAGHPGHAVAAARDMLRVLAELNRERERVGEPALKLGIGIHTGVVAAGMLGAASQSEYTVIGDAVNVASRIEGLTKDHGAPILISETTWSQLAEPRPGRRIDGVTIRGRVEPVALYALDA